MSHEEMMAKLAELREESRRNLEIIRELLPDSEALEDDDDEEIADARETSPAGDDVAWEDFLVAHTELGQPIGRLEFTDEELHVALVEARKRWFRYMLETHPERPADPGARAEEVARALRDPGMQSDSERAYGRACGVYPVTRSDVGRVVGRLMRLEREGAVSRTPSPWGSFWRSEADQEEADDA